MKNKAQNEIVGLVIIVVLITIVGVIFLGLSMDPNPPIKSSVELDDFLQASMHYTTKCARGYVPNYMDMQDLIKACYKGQRCSDGNLSCKILNQTFPRLVEESFHVSELSKNKAYNINIYYRYIDEDTPRENILLFDKGNFDDCSSTAGSSFPIFVDNGNINVDLDFCYG